MNESEIDEAAYRHKAHPVLGKATRFLASFRDEVNQNSDGWCYWRLPARAAKGLIALIQNGPDQATEAAYKKALVPIKSFYTRRGKAAGMRFPAEV